jgi:acid phosphatase
MTRLRSAALVLALSAALAGCQTVAEAPAATPMPKPAASEPAVPAHDNLNATAWVQSSVEARMAHRQAWRSAERLLDAALADASWDALAANDRVAPVAGLPPAIIVDVDETVLDNSPYQVRLIREDGSFDDATWNAWVDEARATAVAGAPEFAQAAAKRGVPPPAESQFLGLGFDTPGCVPKGSDKGCRRQFVAQRYRVLMQFGDQLGDFVSVSDNGLEARATQLQGFDAWVGQRWFMLANPSYGSWESALYGNDRSLSRDAQRSAKRAALRD